jgi:hypothetical protein
VDIVILSAERRNKTPVFMPRVRNTCSCLDWIRAKSASKVVTQMKGKILMLLPETADGFRATICTLRSLDESEGLSFHTSSLPED